MSTTVDRLIEGYRQRREEAEQLKPIDTGKWDHVKITAIETTHKERYSLFCTRCKERKNPAVVPFVSTICADCVKPDEQERFWSLHEQWSGKAPPPIRKIPILPPPPQEPAKPMNAPKRQPEPTNVTPLKAAPEPAPQSVYAQADRWLRQRAASYALRQCDGYSVAVIAITCKDQERNVAQLKFQVRYPEDDQREKERIVIGAAAKLQSFLSDFEAGRQLA